MLKKNKASERKRISAAAIFMSAVIVFAGCTPSGNLASEEKVKVSPTEAPTSTPTPIPTFTPTPIPSFTPTPTPSGATTPIPADSIISTKQQDTNYFYSTANVNVRSEASSDGKILGTLEAKTKVDVLEIVNDNWAKIEYKEQTGFVNKKYLVAEAEYDPNNYSDTSNDNKDKNNTNYDEEYDDYDNGDDTYHEMTEEEYEALNNARAAAMMETPENTGGGEASGEGTSDTDADAAGDGGSGDEGSGDGGSGDGGSDEVGSDTAADTGEEFDEQASD